MVYLHFIIPLYKPYSSVSDKWESVIIKQTREHDGAA